MEMGRSIPTFILLICLLKVYLTSAIPANYHHDVKCDVEKYLIGNISKVDFYSNYKEMKPVIIVMDDKVVGNTYSTWNNDQMTSETTFSKLMDKFGHLSVVLASSNSYSHEKKHTTMKEYLNYINETNRNIKTNLMADKSSTPDEDFVTITRTSSTNCPNSICTEFEINDNQLNSVMNSKGNETFYLFGDTRGGDWTVLEEMYNPPVFTHGHQSLSFGVGGYLSGVPFHTHGPVWNEVLHGSKRWFLYPPDNKPDFQPDDSQLQWLQEIYPQINKDDQNEKLQECVLKPGEVLYLPSEWWHATLNLDEYTCFVATFCE